MNKGEARILKDINDHNGATTIQTKKSSESKAIRSLAEKGLIKINSEKQRAVKIAKSWNFGRDTIYTTEYEMVFAVEVVK